MAQVSVTVTLDLPAGMTAAQALVFITDEYNYDGSKNVNETRVEFIKRRVGMILKDALRVGRKRAAIAQIADPDDITIV